MIAVTPDQVTAGRYTARPAVETAKRLGVHVLDLDVPNTIDAVRQEMDSWNVTLFHSLGSLSFETLATQSAGRGFKVACRVV
jgi:hypothetical protein